VLKSENPRENVLAAGLGGHAVQLLIARCENLDGDVVALADHIDEVVRDKLVGGQVEGVDLALGVTAHLFDPASGRRSGALSAITRV